MKERELTLSTNMDETIKNLSENQIFNITKLINNFELAFYQLKEMVLKNTLEVGFSETLLTLIEFNISEILKALDYDSVLAKERAERVKTIRELNIENRELRKKLGEKLSNDEIRESVKNLKNKITEWARQTKVFSFPKEFYLNESGYIIIDFYFNSLDFELSHQEQKEESEKIKNQGWDLFYKKNNSMAFLDTDNNRKRMIKLLKDRFPSINIKSFESFHWHGSPENQFHLRTISIIIFNLDDI